MSRLRDLLPSLPRLDDGGIDIDDVDEPDDLQGKVLNGDVCCEPWEHEDLRDLVEEFRDPDSAEIQTPEEIEARERCADQLEEVIDE